LRIEGVSRIISSQMALQNELPCPIVGIYKTCSCYSLHYLYSIDQEPLGIRYVSSSSD